MRKAIEEPVNAIVDAVKTYPRQVPAGAVGRHHGPGIVLTGGGALLRGTRRAAAPETGMTDPHRRGPAGQRGARSGKCVEEFEALQQVARRPAAQMTRTLRFRRTG
ncbi:hypothetical protein GCM10023238_28850 [Streptomyces heliomycini]